MPTTTPLRVALSAALVALPACEIGDVSITTTSQDESSGDTGPELDSTGTGDSASSSVLPAESSEGETSTGSSDTTTGGDVLTCDEFSLGDFDFLYSGCCEESAWDGTCAEWCEAHALGPCVFIEVHDDTNECSTDGAFAPVCDQNPWDFFQAPLFSIRCACAFP